MLLLSLLIWAATLIGYVQPYTKHECGTKYSCLVPSRCVGGKGANKDIIKIVTDATQTIDPSCTLIIRFHQYSKSKMRVILETQDTTDDYALIDVRVKGRGGADLKKIEPLFRCTRDGDSAVGRVGEKNATQVGGMNAISPLRCVFDAARQDEERVWYINNKDSVEAEIIGSKKTETFRFDKEANNIDEFCNPELLVGPKPNDAENRPTERYAPIQYDLGSLVCPPSYDRIEYRNSTYQIIETIVCLEDSGFVINGVPFTNPEQTLEVRCVADADYFCDYDVKAPPGLDKRKRLVVTPGKPDEKKRSRIECPANYPYFVMGSRAPVVDYNLTCRTKLTKQLWHYGDTAITKDGPIVYCTDARTCPKLAPTSFDGSYLDKDNQPTCQKDGTLQLKKGGSTMMDPFEGRVGCNEKTGWMGYLSKGQWQRITDEVFYCQYVNHAEQLDEKDRKDVWATIWASFGGSSAVCITAGLIYLLYRYKKDNNQRFAAEQEQLAESTRARERGNELDIKKGKEKGNEIRQFEPVRSARSLCGKKMPLRLTNEPDPEPTTLKTKNSAWSLPAFTIATPELLTESPLSARPIEDTLFDKVFAKMDESFKTTMAQLPAMWAGNWRLLAKAHSVRVNKVSRAEALFYKMKAEGSVTGEYVPVTTHPSLASEARTAAIAAAYKKTTPAAAAKKPQPQQQPESDGKESEKPPAAK